MDEAFIDPSQNMLLINKMPPLLFVATLQQSIT
jgi:hypothetical protein